MELFLVEAYDLKRLLNIYRLYRKAFPSNERKPFVLMLKKRRKKYLKYFPLKIEMVLS